MEPKVSFPCAQEPPTGPCHQTEDMLIFCHLPSGVFPSGCCTYIVCAFIFLMCIYTQLSSVCVTILLVFSKEHISLSPLLCSLLHSSSILSPNCLFCIHFLSTPFFSPSVSRWRSFIPIQNNMQNYCFVHVVSTFMFLDRFWTKCYTALYLISS